MALQHIVLYECDGPGCTERGSPTEERYWGKFPPGWLHMQLCVWPTLQNGQAAGVAFHSYACLLAYVRERGPRGPQEEEEA